MKQKKMQWIVYAGIAVVLLVLSFFLIWNFAAKTYTGKTVLWIRSSDSFLTGSQSADDILDSVTIAQLLSEAGENQQVAQALIQQYNLPYTCEELLQAVAVTHPENTMLLEFSFQLNSAQEASLVAQEYPAILIALLQESFHFKGYDVIYRTQDVADSTVWEVFREATIITVLIMGLLLFFVYLRPLKQRMAVIKKRLAREKASRPLRTVLLGHWKSMVAVFFVVFGVTFLAFSLSGHYEYESKSFLSVSVPSDFSQIKANNVASVAMAHTADDTFFTLFYQSLSQDLRNRYSEKEVRQSIRLEEDVTFGTGILTLTCHTKSQQDTAAITQAYTEFFCQTLQSWCGYATYTTLGPPTADYTSYLLPNLGVSILAASFCSYLYANLWQCGCLPCRRKSEPDVTE